MDLVLYARLLPLWDTDHLTHCKIVVALVVVTVVVVVVTAVVIVLLRAHLPVAQTWRPDNTRIRLQISNFFL